MVQISGTPLPVNPNQLGQLAVKVGSLPEAMLRPGQTLLMTATQQAKAGESTQVRVGGKTLQAILPTAVAPGDQIMVKVGRSSDGQPQMQLLGQKGAPALQLPAKEAAQMTGKAGALMVSVKETAEGIQIKVGSRTFSPAQLGVKASELPRGSWPARLIANGAGLSLIPMASESLQIRQAAGQMALSANPLAMQAAVEMAEKAEAGSGAYQADASQPQQGVPWLSLPGGQSAAIEMGPLRLEDQEKGSAKIELWGNTLGPVSIALDRSPAGIRISVSADQAACQKLQEGSRELSGRLRQITGKPAQVTVHQHLVRPLPPEGFEGYG